MSVSLILLLHGLFLTLRLSGSAGSFPRPLKSEEERECLLRAAQGDMCARSSLIEHNLRLVAHIVKKYYTQTGDQDDLISIGTIGLIKAVSTYDMEKKIKLATYASRCIENEILMYLRKTRRLALELSLSETLDTDQEGNALSLMDVVKVDDNMLEELDAQDSFRRVRCCVETCLEPREREIIMRRYGLDGAPPRTQREVSESFGISRSYVSRLEKKALEKLRAGMEGTVGES